MLSVIGGTLNGSGNGGRTREANSTSSIGDDGVSVGESTIGRSGVGEEVKRKERGSIPFPNTPSQDSLRVGRVVNGGEEEGEETTVNDVSVGEEEEEEGEGRGSPR